MPMLAFFQTTPIIKVGVLIIIGLYVLFAFVIFNQTRTMNRLISHSSSAVLEAIAIIHIIAAILLFLTGAAIL